MRAGDPIRRHGRRRAAAVAVALAGAVAVTTVLALKAASRQGLVAYVLLTRDGLPPLGAEAPLAVERAFTSGGFEPRRVEVGGRGAAPRDAAGMQRWLEQLGGDPDAASAFWIERAADGGLEVRAALWSRRPFEAIPGSGVMTPFAEERERVRVAAQPASRMEALRAVAVRVAARLMPAPAAGDRPAPGRPARSASLPPIRRLGLLRFSHDWVVEDEEIVRAYGRQPVSANLQNNVYDVVNDLVSSGPPWSSVKDFTVSADEVRYQEMFAPVLAIGQKARPRHKEDKLLGICSRLDADALLFGHLHQEPGSALEVHVHLFLKANESWYSARSEWKGDVAGQLRQMLEDLGRQAAAVTPRASGEGAAAPPGAR